MNKPIQKFTTVIAVDPGASGGITVHRSGEPITAYAMPDTDGDVLQRIRELTPDPARCVAFVERVSGYVGRAQPASGAFVFGRGVGIVIGILMERGVRVELVLPRAWQKRLSLGTASACTSPAEWKRRLRGEAQRRFPSLIPTLRTADALLLLDFGLASLRTGNES